MDLFCHGPNIPSVLLLCSKDSQVQLNFIAVFLGLKEKPSVPESTEYVTVNITSVYH